MKISKYLILLNLLISFSTIFSEYFYQIIHDDNNLKTIKKSLFSFSKTTNFPLLVFIETKYYNYNGDLVMENKFTCENLTFNPYFYKYK